MDVKNFKYLQLMAGLYISILLAALLLSNRIVVVVFGIHTLGSSLLIVLALAMADIITEVYGYKIMKKIIWTALICITFFTVMLEIINLLPKPRYYLLDNYYNDIISSILIIAALGVFEIIIGQFIDIYFLTKWKILLKGKYFWLRCLGSTVIGSFVMTCVGYLSRFYLLPFEQAIKFVLVAYALKLIFAVIFATPSTVITWVLKKVEPQELLEQKAINFNPFNLKD